MEFQSNLSMGITSVDCWKRFWKFLPFFVDVVRFSWQLGLQLSWHTEWNDCDRHRHWFRFDCPSNTICLRSLCALATQCAAMIDEVMQSSAHNCRIMVDHVADSSQRRNSNLNVLRAHRRMTLCRQRFDWCHRHFDCWTYRHHLCSTIDVVQWKSLVWSASTRNRHDVR